MHAWLVPATRIRSHRRNMGITANNPVHMMHSMQVYTSIQGTEALYDTELHVSNRERLVLSGTDRGWQDNTTCDVVHS